MHEKPNQTFERSENRLMASNAELSITRHHSCLKLFYDKAKNNQKYRNEIDIYKKYQYPAPNRTASLPHYIIY